MVTSNPRQALAAWQKLWQGQPLDEEDGVALANLVVIRDDDKIEQRQVRSLLFHALRQKEQIHALRQKEQKRTS